MKKKAIIVLMVLSLGFNVGVIGTMGYHWVKHKAFKCSPQAEAARHQKHLKKILHLTNIQAQNMRTDWENLQKIVVPIKKKLDVNRAVLFTLIDSTATDTAAIDKAIGDVVPLQMELEKTIIEHSLAFSRTLTPDQRQRFKAMFQKSAKRMPHGSGLIPGKMDC